MKSFIALIGLTVLSLATLPGCGGEDIELPAVVPVAGTVTLDDKPLEGASITFRPAQVDPKSGEKVYSARATSDADGKYTAMTYYSAGHDLEGIVPGNYVITVTKMGDPPAAAPTSHASAAESVKQVGPSTGTAHGVNAPGNILPERYASATSSGMSLEVKAGESITHPIELSSK